MDAKSFVSMKIIMIDVFEDSFKNCLFFKSLSFLLSVFIFKVKNQISP